MIDAAEAAIGFAHGRKRDDLERDQMLLFALVRAVEVLGEAAARLSDDTRTKAPEIPWTLIVSMRNRLIHGYFDIDADIVWQTVATELPRLVPALRKLLAT
jgi:uncharacterized protein with HEPN domain